MRKKKIKRRVFKFTNGGKRESTQEARERVLRVAKKRGSITNQQASIIGKWAQAWYHLDAMRKAGLLKKGGFNLWKPK